jgi:NADH-quinone oxidoreductase subunit L
MGAVMTAFYMTRLVVRIFFGEFRGWAIVANWKAPAHAHHADHAHDAHGHGAQHAHAEHVPDASLEGPRPSESPWQMVLPLAILGTFALIGGALNAHAIFHFHPLDDWLMPVFQVAKSGVHELPNAKELEMVLLVPGLLAFAAGVGGAYWVYLMQRGAPARELAAKMPGLHRLVYEKWRIDELYDETIIGAVDSLAEFAVWFDRWIVDGIVARLTSFLVAASGTVLRYAQTGRVQAYAAAMVFGVGGLGWFLIAPHADVKVDGNPQSGAYTLRASPGLGYLYRWDVNGDGKWDSDAFGTTAEVKFELEPGEKRTPALEVRNAFGRTGSEQFEIERPKPDASRGAPGTALRVQRGADGTLRGSPLNKPAAAAAPDKLPNDAAQRVIRALQQQQKEP